MKQVKKTLALAMSALMLLAMLTGCGSSKKDDAPAADSGIDAARYYRDEVVALTQKAGELIGRLESLVDAKAWPYPTYADILFSV